jgi:PAS domain S-box-containing protein
MPDWLFQIMRPRIWTVMKHDESDDRDTVEALRTKEERWNLALQGARIGVFDIDLLERTSSTSGTWRELAGFSHTDLIDTEREWWSRIHPEDLAKVRAANIDCLKGRVDRVSVEYRFKFHDGTWHWMRSNAQVVERTADGRAKRFLGTMTDITDLKQAHAEIAAQDIEFRQLVANAPVAEALLSLEGTFLLVNPAFCAFTGYSEDELVGRTLQEIPTAGEFLLDREKVRGMLKGLITSYTVEKRYTRPDGSEAHGLLSVSILKESVNRETRFIAQIQDVTERMQFEQSKSDFVAIVSHELRTPLTSINGSLGLVLGFMAAELPEKSKHLLEIANANCERLLFLVNDLLDMEKLISGKMQFQSDCHSVQALLDQAIVNNRPFADLGEIKLTVEPVDAGLDCIVDGKRFQQVLSNLLSNAVKFSPAGASVEITTQVSTKHLRISITDHGAGITAASAIKLFKPFSQGDSSSSRVQGGTGLGLSICKQIVERMGGEIGFTSQPGIETTFWFTVLRPVPQALAIRQA